MTNISTKYYISKPSMDRAQQYTGRFNEAVRRTGGIVEYCKGAAALTQKDTKRGETTHDAHDRRKHETIA